MQPATASTNAGQQVDHTGPSRPVIHVVTPDLPRDLAEAIADQDQDQANKRPSAFEDDMDEHPEKHFLSPVYPYEYDDWADDSDDEDHNDVEWSAGITDFSLFHEERKRAEVTGGRLDAKWDGIVAGQQGALHRSLQRSHSSPLPISSFCTSSEQIPELTPDNSPRMLDFESGSPPKDVRRTPTLSSSRLKPRLSTPMLEVFEDDAEENDDEDYDDEPLSFHVRTRQQQRRELSKANRKMQRPGLRSCRTLSGRAHSWRRPSWNIYPLGEEEADGAEHEQREERMPAGHPPLVPLLVRRNSDGQY